MVGTHTAVDPVRGLRAEREYESGRGSPIDLALLCELGKLGISLGEPPQGKVKERGEWNYLMFPEAQVASDLPGVVQTIEEAVQRLGGLAHDA